MGHRTRRIVAARRLIAAAFTLIVAGLPLAGCADPPAAGSSPAHAETSKVEPVAGSDVSRVTLSADAAHRLGIQTDLVRETVVAGLPRKVVPYSAVLYDATGKTYAYGNPKPLVYVRVALDVDFVGGDLAVLNAGPPAGTAVVTVGASELFGTEFEVGGE